MSINLNNQASRAEFVRDVTTTSTLPVNGESFTGAHIQDIAAQIDAIQYILGKPGLRQGVPAAEGSHTALAGTAVSSLTSVVFSASQTALVVGSLIAGASPTSTGWRRVTANPGGLTVTVDRAFDVDLASEQAYVHATIAERLNNSASPVLQGYRYGLTLSNNGTDPTNDIDIAAGYAVDSTNAAGMTLAAGITKRLDAAWAVGTGNGGLDTGSIANTTYHIWLIRRPDTGVVDALFSTSASSPSMPANYTQKRRIGSIIRSGGAIILFIQYDRKFVYMTPVLDVSS